MRERNELTFDIDSDGFLLRFFFFCGRMEGEKEGKESGAGWGSEHGVGGFKWEIKLVRGRLC